jgi:hypothetical protein
VAVSIDPLLATTLADARLQLHHAAQLVTATGISYLPAQPDDSHTNLEWIDDIRALAGHVIPAAQPFRAAVQPADLSLSILDEDDKIVGSTLLNGLTMDAARDWLSARVAERGGDGDRLTLKRHYEIPKHALDDGGTFDAKNAAALAQLDAWYDAAHRALEDVRGANAGASDVRCWPHHFDIATLIELGGGRTIGVGMEPGDQYFDEPYFYVNMSPSPKPEAGKAPLGGGGTWHTQDWVGAVLPGSRVSDEDAGAQIAAFLTSAVAACRSIQGAAK